MPKPQDLTTEFIASALLYRMVEKEEEIPLIVAKTDLEFVDSEITTLSTMGAIKANAEEQCWDITDKGEAIFERLLDTYEALIDLDIFSGVNLSLDLEDDLFDEEGLIAEGKLDPRFDEPVNDDEAEVFGTTDLRLAVLDFLAEKYCKKKNLPFSGKTRHDVLSRVVFIQELGGDKFIDDKAFFDLKLGGTSSEINEIVTSVPPWIELAKEFDPPNKLMEMIIDAGFRDAQKRQLLGEENQTIWMDEANRAKLLEHLLEPLVC